MKQKDTQPEARKKSPSARICIGVDKLNDTSFLYAIQEKHVLKEIRNRTSALRKL